MNFKENMRFLMERKDIQIKELSNRTGISENTIKTYLKTDSAEPKVSNALLIADALGVSVEFLATGTTNKDNGFTYTLLEIISTMKQLSLRDQQVLLATVQAMKERPVSR